MAHRYSWARVNGPLPPGVQLDHVCRNPRCVNPDHLQIVTQCENLLRMKCWRNLVARIKELETFIAAHGLKIPHEHKKKENT
ncbi:HNH endonuclease [bacterium]|nr:HNH endonuclease [bacterium]